MFLQAIKGIVSGGAGNTLLDKLEAYWPFDEVGTDVAHYDVHNNHDFGGATGGTVDVAGLHGRAIQFGSNDRIQSAVAGWPTGTGSFAVSLWANFNAVGTNNDFLMWRCRSSASGSTVPGDWAIQRLNNSGEQAMDFHISSDGSFNDWDGDRARSQGTVTATGLYHIYCHYNSLNGEMAISVNNEPLITKTLSHTFFNVSSPVLRCGRMTSSFPHGFEGWLDETCYFNEPLTVEERNWLYNDGNGRVYTDFPAYEPVTVSLLGGLVSWWSLDEASGNRVDSHGSNDLTEVGTVGSTVGKVGSAVDATMGATTRLEKLTTVGMNTGENDWAVACWVNIDAIASTINTIVSLSTVLFNSNDDNAFWVDYRGGTDEKFRLIVRTGTSSQVVTVDEITPASTGTWYFIYAYHDNAASEIGISVNDGTLYTFTYTGTPNSQTGCFSLGRIGSSNTGNDIYPLNGKIDETAFWNRVLHPDEVTALYNDGNGIRLPESLVSNGLTNLVPDSNDLTQRSTANTPIVSFDQIGIDGSANSASYIEDNSTSSGEYAFDWFDQTTGNTDQYAARFFIKKDTNQTRFMECHLRARSSSTNVLTGDGVALSINTQTGESSARIDTGTNTWQVLSYDENWWEVRIDHVNASLRWIAVGVIPAAGNTLGVYAGPPIGSVICGNMELYRAAAKEDTAGLPNIT